MPRRKIDDLLSTHQSHYSRLTHLLKHAENQASWTSQLRALLPAELAAHCRVADITRGSLVIQVGSAAWATRLRFVVVDRLPLLQQLADFRDVQDIRLQVNTTAP